MENEEIKENEFASIAEEDVTPEYEENEFIENTNSTEPEFSESNAGTTYDFSQAPDSVSMPERLDIDGQQVDIIKGELIIPPTAWEWQPSKFDPNKKYKTCPFKIHMKTKDGQLQIENYSGVRVFKSKDGKYSQPTIWKEGKTQAAKLMKAYAEYANKDIKEVTLKQFGMFLNSGVAKGIIKSKEITNPETNEEIKKNLIDKFV